MDVTKLAELIKEIDAEFLVEALSKREIVHDLTQEKWVEKQVTQAKRELSAKVTETTYLIYALPKKYAPYKTLLLDLTGKTIISKESTSVLLNRYVQQLGVNQDVLSHCQQLLFDKSIYRVPYIYNGKIFLPLDATSRKVGSWLALHLVVQYGIAERYRHVWVEFENHVKLILNMQMKSFELQVERSSKIFYLQHYLGEQFLQHISGKQKDDKYMMARRITHPDNQVPITTRELDYFSELLAETMKLEEKRVNTVNKKK